MVQMTAVKQIQVILYIICTDYINHLAACSFKLRSDLCSHTQSSNTFQILLQFSLSNTQASRTITTPKHEFGETVYRQMSADDLVSNSEFPLNIQY